MLGAVMTAEAFLARSQRRQHWAAQIVLVVAVSIAAGAAMAFLAGARRSSTVVDRFRNAAPVHHVDVYSPSGQLDQQTLLSRPDVVRADPSYYLAMSFVYPDGSLEFVNGLSYSVEVENPTVRVLDGRKPHDEAFEIAVNHGFVELTGLSVGDVAPFVMFAPEQIDEVERGIYEPAGPHYDMRIVGVVRTPNEIVTDEVHNAGTQFVGNFANVVISSRFVDEHKDEYLGFGSSFAVRLASGAAGVQPFIDDLTADLGPDSDLIAGAASQDDRSVLFATPVDLETTTLLSVGAGMAAAALAVVLLLLRIQQRSLERESQAAASLGLTGGRLAATAALRVGPSALGAAAGAVAVSIALSSRFPIGLGRQLELDGGTHVDTLVAPLGALIVAGAIVGLAVLMARRPRPLVAAATQSRTSSSWPQQLPLAAGLGVRLAGGASRRRTTTVVGAGVGAVALAVVIAVGMMTAGSDRLYSHPDRRGWEWDAAIGNTNFPLDPDRLAQLTADPELSRLTAVGYGQVLINGVSCEVLAIDPLGSAPPQVLAGRLPVAPTEIALGPGLMRLVGAGLGDQVVLSLSGSEFTDEEFASPKDVTLTVVGESVSPVFGESDPADIGVVALGAIAAGGGNSTPRLVLANFVDSDHPAAAEALADRITEEIHTDIIPGRIVSMHRARGVPLAGLGLAAGLGLFVLAATLASLGRSNQRTLATLRALGLDRRRQAAALAWQGVAIAGVVVVLGVFAGLLAGATLWRRITEDLGVRPGIVLPWSLIVGLVIVPAVAVIVSIGARRSTHQSLADALRSE